MIILYTRQDDLKNFQMKKFRLRKYSSPLYIGPPLILRRPPMSKRERKDRQYLTGTERQQQRSYSPAIKTRGKTTIYLAGFGGRTD
jgi:hypothetical protein